MTQRRTCRKRLREIEKELGWEGEEKIDYSHLPVIHIKHSKKEKKQHKKRERKLIKHQYYELLGTFDEFTRNEIIDNFDDKFEAVKYMESLKQRCNTEYEDLQYYETIEDAVACHKEKTIPSSDPIVQAGCWDQWEEYADSLKTHSVAKIWKKRKKFLSRITKSKKKLQKRYKSFSLYDPLFRARKIDEVELKKKLKLITKENMERRDAFLEKAEELFGLRDPYMIKQFKDRTKEASKAINKYVIDMNRSLIPVESKVSLEGFYNG